MLLQTTYSLKCHANNADKLLSTVTAKHDINS